MASKVAKLGLEGKTIARTEWVAPAEEALQGGNANLKIVFTDGTHVTVHYSCMGGVFVVEE